MKQIRIGKRYSLRVPNSREFRVSGNFSGTALYTEIVNKTGKTPPRMSLSSADQVATILFNDDHLVGDVLEMITTEQSMVVKSYEKPANKNSIAGRLYFRGEIEKEQKALYPHLKYANCVSFDQSYFLRTIGQIRIQANLGNDFKLFTGSGFGAIQAFWGALSLDPEDLIQWFINDFKKSIHKSYAKKISQALIVNSVRSNYDTDRINPASAKRKIRQLFKQGKRDLLVKDCTKEIWIPLQDISGRTKTVTKESCPDFPIYEVVSASIFDPIFFKTNPDQVKGMGVMAGDILKNNAKFIRKNNPTINIVSVGSPVRKFDKGPELTTRSEQSLKVKNDKHQADLDFVIEGRHDRYECNPVDEFSQMETSQKAIEAAYFSGGLDA